MDESIDFVFTYVDFSDDEYKKLLIKYAKKVDKKLLKSKNLFLDRYIDFDEIYYSVQSVKKYLSTDQNKLYDLIWSRALSSQMESAKFDRNTITISSDNNDTICKASGSVLKFDGFLKIYKKIISYNIHQILIVLHF